MKCLGVAHDLLLTVSQHYHVLSIMDAGLVDGTIQG